jgi:CheY-like chemotaxis protein
VIRGTDLLVLQGMEVLVVDDEADSRALLRIMLSQAGAEVITVASVKEALTELKQSVPATFPHSFHSKAGG